MKTELLKRARKWFNSDYVSRETNRAHIKKWCAMIRFLGDKWVMVKPMGRA